MKIQLFAAMSTFACLAAASAHAQASNPAYLHALTDLKAAEVDVATRGGDAAMAPHEKLAVQHINSAQYIIYKVAPSEKKNVRELPKADADPSARSGKLHDAASYLQKAYSDLNEAESDKANLDARHRALEEVKAAQYEVGAAIDDFAKHK